MREIEVAARKTPAEERYRRMARAVDEDGERLEEVALKHGIAPATLRWWRSELKRRDRARTAGTRTEALLPVRLTSPMPAAVTASRIAFEVALHGGRRLLRIPPGFDPAEVRLVVEALEDGPC